MQEATSNAGVVISQQTVADSNAKKAKARKSLAELPVYRSSANLKYVIVSMMGRGPRRLAKFFDEMLVTSSEVSKSIGLADASRVSDDRVWYINCALTLVYELRTDITILQRLGIIGRDSENKAKALVRSMIAQLVAWRDYTGSRGVSN